MRPWAILLCASVAVIYGFPATEGYGVTYILPDRPTFNITPHVELASNAFGNLSSHVTVTVKTRFYNIFSICTNLKNLVQAICRHSPHVYVFIYANEVKEDVCTRYWSGFKTDRITFVTTKYSTDFNTKIFWKLDGTVLPVTNWYEMANTIEAENPNAGKKKIILDWNKKEDMEFITNDDISLPTSGKKEDDLPITLKNPNNNHFEEDMASTRRNRRAAMLFVGMISCLILVAAYAIRSNFCVTDETTMEEMNLDELITPPPSNKHSIVTINNKI